MGLFDTFGKALTSTSVTRGLSYANNYEQDIQNAIRMNQLKMERQNQREQKARYYAELLKEGVAHDELGSKRLEVFYDQLNAELGDFIMNAPKNWEQNILYQKQFHQIADKYLNNGILAESQRVKMEMEKMYADKNMTPAHLEENLKRYKAYKEQPFDPENPDAELDYKFSYSMMPTVNITQAVANVAKNMGLLKSTKVGDEWIIESVEAKPGEIDAAVAQLYGTPEYSYALEVAWKNYQEGVKGNSQLDIYKSKLEYAKALVQNTTPLEKIHKQINPEHKMKLAYQLKQLEKFGSGTYVPDKFYNLVTALNDKGEEIVGNDALVFAGIEKNGIIAWNPNMPSNKPKAYINGMGDIEKAGLQQINYLVVESAERMFIDPATGLQYIEAVASVPVTDVDYNKMKDAGFLEVRPETTEMGRKSGKSFNFNFDADEKMMRGKIYIPADLSNMNAAWEYLDWGIDQKGREALFQSGQLNNLTGFAAKKEWDFMNQVTSTEETKEGNYNEIQQSSLQGINSKLKQFETE